MAVIYYNRNKWPPNTQQIVVTGVFTVTTLLLSHVFINSLHSFKDQWSHSKYNVHTKNKAMTVLPFPCKWHLLCSTPPWFWKRYQPNLSSRFFTCGGNTNRNVQNVLLISSLVPELFFCGSIVAETVWMIRSMNALSTPCEVQHTAL